jgi:very-short-patch-repair endonuclease
VDAVIAGIAERQHGVVARWQLGGAGISRNAIEGRLERQALHRLHRGVYAVGHRVLSQDAKWLAAVLAFGPEAVLSHRSAGQLWSIVPRRAIAPEVTKPKHVRGKPALVVHQSIVPTDERTVVDGIPVTSVFRTMVDLARVLRPRELERAWNELKIRGHSDRVPMTEMLARHRGKRGTVALRALLGSTKPEGVTRNEFEETFLALLDAHGIPRPRFNATLFLRGRFYEIDSLWEDQGLALELDGREVHATPRAFEGDRRRDRVLLAEGYRTSRVTWRQLRDEPVEIVADLRRSLAADRGGERGVAAPSSPSST